MFDRDDTPVPRQPIPLRTTRDRDLGQMLNADVSSPPDDLQHALNHNQIASKGWLVDELLDALGGRFGTVHLLGGWYGVLGALLLGDPRFQIEQVLSYDIDPACARVAEALNRAYVAAGRFRAITANVCELDYGAPNGASNGISNGAPNGDLNGHRNGSTSVRGLPAFGGRAEDLVINTSCEHMTPTAAWYDRVPSGMYLVCQSNDYFDCPEHVNCMADLEAFKADVPMGELFYEGTLARKKYTRFMVIGRK